MGLQYFQCQAGRRSRDPTMCLNSRMGSSSTSSCIGTHRQNQRHCLCWSSAQARGQRRSASASALIGLPRSSTDYAHHFRQSPCASKPASSMTDKRPITLSQSSIISPGEPTFFRTSDMSDQSGSSRLQVLFQAAMHDYEKKTGIVLARHPLAEKLQNCDSVESVTAVFQEQTQAFSGFRAGDKVFKPLKNIVSLLHKLSSAADTIGLVRPCAIIQCLKFLNLIL
jgi:hypothetical protein